jgi:hypothetical protein
MRTFESLQAAARNWGLSLTRTEGKDPVYALGVEGGRHPFRTQSLAEIHGMIWRHRLAMAGRHGAAA